MPQTPAVAAMQGGGAGAVALMIATWIHILFPDLGLTDVQIGITAAGLAAIIAFIIQKLTGRSKLVIEDNPTPIPPSQNQENTHA